MDSEEKRKTVARHLKAIDKIRSREEQQLIQQRAKQRKAGRGSRTRDRADWSEYDDDEPFEDFEPMRRDASEAALVGNLPPATLEHPWLVIDTGPRTVTLAKDAKQREAHVGGSPLPQGRPVVGDHAAITELAGGEARLKSIAPRKSLLERRDPGQVHRTKVLAANVDVALIVTTAKDGGLHERLLDRLRVAVENGGIEPLVVVSKVDLLSSGERERVESQLAELRASGIAATSTSSVSGEGIADLVDELAGRIAVVVGPSGAGKSALLNALDPDHERATGAVRDQDRRGRHTTTQASMFRWADDGWLIDTPGIREFGVVHLDADSLLESFPVLAKWAADCPRGCEHTTDPGCALKLAADSDARLARDLASYLKLRQDLD